ncbi:endonuclease/exonuclease/phosphatase family protein [Actinomadura craniellae]|uniref:Endonuclease/exonuclease/phosphatase family protein n=1 Tax=Actinomadura craniellae TaxID=2231787 RepID=A0A365GYN0_9ACTN|nr:endonuclease/exonuclease/phosphatase family protein [Actinomadura craniellae]RAY11945.1 endonuclease/exonuclease/phosphatase family protein [Actinomadura craniellae]
MTDEGPFGAIGRHWRAAVAWVAVGSWGIWAVFRLVGADRLPGIGVPAVPLLALTPYVAAVSLVPVGCALLLRRRRAAAVGGAVALALAATVLPRAFGQAQPAAHGPELRVLTANLYFGRASAGQLIDLVRRTRPDVLSLQELTPDAVEEYDRAGLRRLLPHTALDARWGAGGSALYARYPLTSLPDPAGGDMAMPRAAFTLPGGVQVDVTAVHPPPPISTPGVAEWRRGLAALPAAGSSGPVRVLAGDFNATLDHARFRALLDRGYADAADRAGAGLVPTWGLTGMIPLTIDHVLVDRRAAVRRVTVHDLSGSDHRAVFAHLVLPG